MQKTKHKSHLLIPDCQVKPNIDLSYCAAIGKYVAARKPDVIVNIGDFADMPSLSSYDVGTAGAEGRRYKEDIEAAVRGMKLLMSPIQAEMKRDRSWKPRLVLTLGNHEERILRHINTNPQLIGKLGIEDLKYESFGWEVYPYLKPVDIDGILYAHYFYNPMNGKPYGGSAQTMLNKVGQSFTMGHRQTIDISIKYLPSGKRLTGLIAGACYAHNEEYKGFQGNNHWRGVVVKHQVQDGQYDPMFVSLDYILRKYGKTNYVK
jgi:hypothetical protein